MTASATAAKIANERPPQLSVAVLAYNEEANVAPVLSELREWLERNEPEAEIVFVDDGSTDGTLEAARTALDGFRATFVSHPYNRGMGAGLKSAARCPRRSARWSAHLFSSIRRGLPNSSPARVSTCAPTRISDWAR